MTDERYKPIVIFGTVLICAGFIGLFMLYNLAKDPTFDNDFSIFVLIMTLWHAITGLGVVLKKHWGLVLFKFYLYVLMIAFPIGTYISIKTRKYIRANNLGEQPGRP